MGKQQWRTELLTVVLCCTLPLFLGAIAGCPSAAPPPAAEPECEDNADCDDGLFCNGAETCVGDECVPGDDPCEEGQECDEANDACLTPCTTDDDCDDGDPCTVDACVTADPGTEGGTCLYTDVECDEGLVCDPDTGDCVECLVDEDCGEGEVCTDGECVAEGGGVQHEQLFTSTFEDPNYKGTGDCLTCHSNHAQDILQTAHWNWSGPVTNVAGLEGEYHGKIDFINDY
jgi:hypothetical protein